MKRNHFWTLSILVTILLAGLSVQAQTQPNLADVDRVGTTAAQFLKIPAGARAIGMGGAYSALATDILAVYWNPAGIARIGGNGEAVFNHANWLAETSYDFAAFSVNLGNLGSIAAHVISFSVPEDVVRTIDNPEGTGEVWRANMISLGVTYARNLTDRFSIGFTGKYVQETIYAMTARGAALDIGFMYTTPYDKLVIGAAITNFGTKMHIVGRNLYFNADPLPEVGSVDAVPSEYRTGYYDMPLGLRFGLAWHAYTSENVKVIAALDGNEPNDNSQYYNTGLEVGVKDIIFLRLGYRAILLENSEQGLTFGLGIRYDAVGTNLKFDFGWADYGRLNNVQFVSLSIRY